MIQRKIANTDKPLLAQAAKRLSEKYGADVVKKSMAQFSGNEVIGAFTDDEQTLLSWIIKDKATGEVIFSFKRDAKPINAPSRMMSAALSASQAPAQSQRQAQAPQQTQMPQQAQPQMQQYPAQEPQPQSRVQEIHEASLKQRPQPQAEMPEQYQGAQEQMFQEPGIQGADGIGDDPFAPQQTLQQGEVYDYYATEPAAGQGYYDESPMGYADDGFADDGYTDGYVDDYADGGYADPYAYSGGDMDDLTAIYGAGAMATMEPLAEDDLDGGWGEGLADSFQYDAVANAQMSELDAGVPYANYAGLSDADTESFFGDGEEAVGMDYDDLTSIPESAYPTIDSAAANAGRLYGAEAAGLTGTGAFAALNNGEITEELIENMPSMRGEAEQQKKSGKSHLLRNIIIVVLVVLVAAAGGALGYKYLSDNHMLPFSDSGTDILNQQSAEDEIDYSKYTQVESDAMDRIKISVGDTVYDIRQKLLDIGMVSAAQGLVQAAEEANAAEILRSGNYIILGSETSEDIISRIVAGDLVPDGVIGVNEGDDLDSIARAIDAAKLPFTGDDFKRAAMNVAAYKDDFSMFADLPAGVPSVEGYLYSDEYNFNHTSIAEDAVRAMLNPTQKWFEDSGVTSKEWHEILTKASMIEKEAMYDDDRPLIASVIDNRLERNMPLQIDATVKYANHSNEARVLDADLEIESPYNTYKVPGLPIGPICSGIPEKDVDAVRLHPKTDYLYYVLRDKEGHHEFCTNADDFQVAKQKYLELFGYTD